MEGRRREDVDWLRVAAVYLLFAFHTAKVFDGGWWHVKDGGESAALDLFTGAVRQWHMPLLFLLAGWAVTPSLARRGAEAFRRERRDRLLIPFVFGCLALLPAVQYAALRNEGEIDGSFLEFLPTFFTDLDRFTWMHLWFLVYLLVFTLLYLPSFGGSAGVPGSSIACRGGLCTRR